MISVGTDILKIDRVDEVTARLGERFVARILTPEEQEARVVQGARDAGLAIVRQRPIVLREGEPPLIGVFLMMRAGDLPEAMRAQTWHEPALVIRRDDGSVHPEYAAVKMGFGFPP